MTIFSRIILVKFLLLINFTYIAQSYEVKKDMENVTPREIVDFWFLEEVAKDHFNKNPELDKKIRDKYLSTYIKASKGELEDWMNKPEGYLALVIVLDQFPRNMFRESPKAFESDEYALFIAKNAIEKGLDKKLTAPQRTFLYMPFMHSENLMVQKESVKIFKDLGREINYKYAVKHLEVIEKYGRFPHRNEVLGRESTPEELEYLSKPGAGF